MSIVFDGEVYSFPFIISSCNRAIGGIEHREYLIRTVYIGWRITLYKAYKLNCIVDMPKALQSNRDALIENINNPCQVLKDVEGDDLATRLQLPSVSHLSLTW